MTVWEAILLGILQGIFIFFPVSSTSHLGLTQHFLIEVARIGGTAGLGFVPLAVGLVVAAVVGISALQRVLELLYRARLRFFSFFAWALAAVVLVSTYRGIL